MISSPIVAAVTPFDERGVVDYVALGDYLDLLIEAGVQSLLVNGTTGEFPSMSLVERREVVDFCRQRWPRRLIAHVGASAVGDTETLIQAANDCADALAVITPYFFADAPEAGIEEFFECALSSARKPVLLYNFPRHTQNSLAPALVTRLSAKLPLLWGVKDSGKDLSITQEFKARCPRLRVFVGDDRIGIRVAELGIDGVVTGAGGPVPELPLGIAAAVGRGDVVAARHLQATFDCYSDARKAMPLTDIAFVKAALAARLPGFPPHVRPPLVTASAEQCQSIRTFMRDNMINKLSPF
ncbi:dihydrodipicolinate synthase family protein [Nocardia sp. NPDC056000]|uniref:dihydrodipicolinate synthase family protein n=1 Tax=Nocardia sp. NPDC056000 TaxID=3345674 RepID=UPI0035DB9302